MAIVQRGNVVLTVKDSSVDYYLNKGYDVVDEVGNVVVATIPTDKLQLQHEYVRLTDKVKALEKELAELKSTPKKSKK